MARTLTVDNDGILDAALSVFGRLGYRRTSMDAIAEECGVSRPTLYLRFKNKHELFLAVGRRALDGVSIAAETAAAGPEGVSERLYAVLCAKLDFLESHFGNTARLGLAAEGGRVAAELVEEYAARHRELVVRLLAEAKVPEPGEAADVFLDAIVGFSLNAVDVTAARQRVRSLISLIIRDDQRRGI